MTSPLDRDPGTRFVRRDLPADAPNVAVARADFTRWLRSVSVGEARLCDVVLAVNEAMANIAEFAYLGTTGGTCDVEAAYDRAARVLTVTVSDQGQWREPDPTCPQRHRGRGIPLMRTLSDAFIIDTSALGTSVCMRFDHVEASMRIGAGAC
ncbi:ATP-binding protein [Mycolicibacterium sp.]|uniref:ATP-binding protein n=1 Tax=Mycolicibacterium sp. TaxID=2320850 RepID=UPI0025F0EBA0|nr:ATP-binding protein [Mycolicibacterium sp.]